MRSAITAFAPQCLPPCDSPCVLSNRNSSSIFHRPHVEQTFPRVPSFVMIAICENHTPLLLTQQVSEQCSTSKEKIQNIFRKKCGCQQPFASRYSRENTNRQIDSNATILPQRCRQRAKRIKSMSARSGQAGTCPSLQRQLYSSVLLRCNLNYTLKMTLTLPLILLHNPLHTCYLMCQYSP